MSSLAVEYCQQIKEHFKKFYAAFPPNDPLKLGDFGTLDDDVFSRLANVNDRFGIQFAVRKGIGQASLVDFTSKDSVEVDFTAAVDGTPGTIPIKAAIEVKFSREDAVFFNSAQCTIDAVEDHVAMGEQILKLLNEGRWEKQFVVVTTLLNSESTTVAVSSSSDSSIKFEASTPGVKEIDLSDASIKLAVRHTKDVSLKIATAGGLTPLIGLSKVQGGILSDDDFGPLGLMLNKRVGIRSVKSVPAFVSLGD